MLAAVAPGYERERRFEQDEYYVRGLTEYEAFVKEKLYSVNLSPTLDNVYNAKVGKGTIHIAPDCKTHEDFKYGIWYGSAGREVGRCRENLVDFKECHIDELRQYCDKYNIPLIYF